MNTLKQNLINHIKTGEIVMKPKWYFVTKATFTILALVLMTLLSVYLFSFVLFVLHQSGLWQAPLFGLRGVIFLVVSSPWLLILFTALFLGVLSILIRHYSFSYRKPMVYSLVGLVFGVIVLSSLLQATTVHTRMSEFTKRHNVPGLAPLYQGVGEKRPAGVAVGALVAITASGCTLKNDQGTIITVGITPTTKLPKEWPLGVGERIIVFGDEYGTSTLEAFGIRRHEKGGGRTPAKNKNHGPFEEASLTQ